MEYFGFTDKPGSVHTKRTMMFKELDTLLHYFHNEEVSREEYINAIVDQNCLSKRSGATRKYTFEYLSDLYGLDSSITLFRTFLYFWNRDPDSRPLLALLCAYSRDRLLRDSSKYILGLDQGTLTSKRDYEMFIDNIHPGRFSEIMLQSLVRNLLSTWTQSGHLIGRSKKTRSTPTVKAGAVAYALLLGYLRGIRGKELFNTEYIKLLDQSFANLVELSDEASRKGWMIQKRIGDIIEIQFSNLITEKELEMSREQN